MSDFNMADMFGKIQEMQSKMQEAQEGLNEVIVEAEAGGGMVKVKANGNKQIVSIKMDNDVVDPSDKEMLEDLIVAGVNKALEKAEAASKEFNDVYIIEKSNEFRGRYHVLGGVISPMDNIGPDKLRIQELLKRVGEDDQINEIILALNPDAEGEATSYYINKLLKQYEVKVTRIAYGIPMGTELEFIDEATLSRAFASRNSF
jgi:DNA-binding YbaB/EbfC family protein